MAAFWMVVTAAIGAMAVVLTARDVLWIVAVEIAAAFYAFFVALHLWPPGH